MLNGDPPKLLGQGSLLENNNNDNNLKMPTYMSFPHGSFINIVSSLELPGNIFLGTNLYMNIFLRLLSFMTLSIKLIEL